MLFPVDVSVDSRIIISLGLLLGISMNPEMQGVCE